MNAKDNDKLVYTTFQQNTGNGTERELAPTSNWSELGETQHFVQFYETDTFLLNSLAEFISTGLLRGEATIVVATSKHREQLGELLRAYGLDVAAFCLSGQCVMLDVEETLSTFMADGAPDPERFVEVMGDIIAQAAQGQRRVRIFGEMVAFLWDKGQYDAAIHLEKLWNHLHTMHSFLLFCAYPMSSFDENALIKPLSDVCAEHTHVIPAESYTALLSPDERLCAIILLQQKARLFETIKDELESQIEDLRRLHETSVRLTSTRDITSVLNEVLQEALAMQGTDIGVLSLYDTEYDTFNIEVRHGSDEPFVACHNTPLITHSGTVIGVLSAHFHQPYHPSERATRLMALYARMAADIIENVQLHHRVQQELEEREQLLIREHIARAEAERTNRMKDEFLATVSHELRTPLTTIIGWIQRLRRGKPDEATLSRGLEVIERNAKTQARLIEDILDISYGITGKLSLSIGPVDLVSVINAAIEAVQLLADSKDIQLALTLDPTARQISGDANRLQQVFWNLLSNAIKFTPAGGRIEVCLEHSGPHVQISVSDTGEGISVDVLPFIFERFRQGDSTSTRKHGGLGLGLAIVRHLIELHGGTVHAESAGAGCGAKFIIRLPRDHACDNAAAMQSG